MELKDTMCVQYSPHELLRIRYMELKDKPPTHTTIHVEHARIRYMELKVDPLGRRGDRDTRGPESVTWS